MAEVTIESERRFAEDSAQRLTRGAPPRERLSSGDPPDHNRDPVLTTIQNLVDDIETARCMDFGFLIFRTHYSDPDLFERFHDQFGTVLDEALDSVPAESGLERIRDRILTKFVTDEVMANQPPEKVALMYLISLDDDDDDDAFEVIEGDDVSPNLEPGLRTPMCLMVDEECMRSVVERTPDSTPFLKAVDPRLATGE